VRIRSETLSVLSAATGTTVKPEMSSVRDAMQSSSRELPHDSVKNEMVTSSTSVNITGLEHFTEYMVKVSSSANVIGAQWVMSVTLVLSATRAK